MYANVWKTIDTPECASEPARLTADNVSKEERSAWTTCLLDSAGLDSISFHSITKMWRFFRLYRGRSNNNVCFCFFFTLALPKICTNWSHCEMLGWSLEGTSRRHCRRDRPKQGKFIFSHGDYEMWLCCCLFVIMMIIGFLIGSANWYITEAILP